MVLLYVLVVLTLLDLGSDMFEMVCHHMSMSGLCLLFLLSAVLSFYVCSC